ncbi:MAG: exodeoxyribonuclease VII large subunit [Immundisolibacter sp.]|uniref:exodeoxyribonuclease VII large subunit n=1 Tax=Immundisolibacter sp. TaxID=1934948 RepID=UPI00199F0ACD|nr:exodeoxyribonuclease VII large subunit [Immundisolibacter sp.]MBC7160939.1 exodeoxyribonuclease VII large subunit [Immundisolibacter sp.]
MPAIEPAVSRAGPPERDVYTPSRLTLEVRALLEAGFPLLWLEGEIGNFTAAASGHLYFTLKDSRAQVRCVMFRSRASLLRERPRTGDQVLLRARVSFYEDRGEFQLLVEHLEPAGDGALRRALEQRKARLAAEGLFDLDRKRPLPTLPQRLVLVTSPRGAAVHDVLTTLARRWPTIQVLLLPVPVQGDGAAPAIVKAIDTASENALGDVLLLVRGGGSLEDLAAFNDEAVVRALARCTLPTVVGVGHEVDFSLADLVADQRAPTPTAAAELVVPDRGEWLAALAQRQRRLLRALQHQLQRQQQRVDYLTRRLVHPGERLRRLGDDLARLQRRLGLATIACLARRRERQERALLRLRAASPARRIAAGAVRLDAAAGRLTRAQTQLLRARGEALAGAAARLHALSPLATLARGYAIVSRPPDLPVVHSAAQLAVGERVRLRLGSGAADARVEAIDANGDED